VSQDVAIFIGSAMVLIGYLIFSAKTEMGTQIKWPLNDIRRQEEKENE